MSHHRWPCVLPIASHQEAHSILSPTLKDAKIYSMGPSPSKALLASCSTFGLFQRRSIDPANPQTHTVIITVLHFVHPVEASVRGFSGSSHGTVRETETMCTTNTTSQPSLCCGILEPPREERPWKSGSSTLAKTLRKRLPAIGVSVP